ncbi:hypothetical protein CF319_g3489 [Tilletia indica]|nr:hypothetical protein CF319_g3489 [Tilletia indica]
MPPKSSTSGSKRNPVILPSSSQDGTSPALSPALSQASESSQGASSTQGEREPWTTAQITALVDCLKDNINYQVVFLPGHHRSHPIKTGAMKKSVMARSIRNQIFSASSNKKPDGVISKIAWTVKIYRQQLQAMSQTGQGLLLEEMRKGPIKNAREQLLAEMPW